MNRILTFIWVLVAITAAVTPTAAATPIAISLAPILDVDTAAAAELRRSGAAERLGWQPGDSVVVVSAHVRQIAPFTFAGVEGLRRVEFAPGSQCEKICEFAFAYCIDLEEIILPEGFNTFAEGCFRNCEKLRSLRVPPGVWFLPKEFCNRCYALREVSLPEGLQKIGAFAFAECEGLEEITLPAGLKEIGNNAFCRCFSLKSIYIPDSVTLLDSYAFANCKILEEVRLPANWERLGELIFSGCESLRKLIAPSPMPPTFECESYIFDPDDAAAYARCELIVPPEAASRYRRRHCWRLFSKQETAGSR